MIKVIKNVALLLLILGLLYVLNRLPDLIMRTISNGANGPGYYHFAVILFTLLTIFIGFLLGSERLFRLRSQEGVWRFETDRLIIIIPLMILSFLFSIYFSSRTVAELIGPLVKVFGLDGGFLSLVRLITGIQIANAIKKVDITANPGKIS